MKRHILKAIYSCSYPLIVGITLLCIAVAAGYCKAWFACIPLSLAGLDAIIQGIVWIKEEVDRSHK